jgi:hypothetical protein
MKRVFIFHPGFIQVNKILKQSSGSAEILLLIQQCTPNLLPHESSPALAFMVERIPTFSCFAILPISITIAKFHSQTVIPTQFLDITAMKLFLCPYSLKNYNLSGLYQL